MRTEQHEHLISDYVVPACLPFKDFIVNRRTDKIKLDKLFYVDYPVGK